MRKATGNAGGGRRTRGFTLIELLITMAMMAVLMGMGVPAMSIFIDEARASASATDLLSDVQLLRSTAVKLNCDVSMAPKTVAGVASWSNGWTITYPAASATTALCVVGGSTPVVVKDHDPLPPKLAVSGPAAAFSMGYDGRVNETSLPLFKLYPSGNSKVKMRCVSVSATGKPTSKVAPDLGRTSC